MIPPPADGPDAMRCLPHSAAAEQSVLGALLLDNAAMAEISSTLNEACFYDFAHRLIFGAIGALLADRAPADVITVFERLQAQEQDQQAGGLVYLNALLQGVPSAANIRSYAEIVADMAAQRALIAGMDESVRVAWDMGQPLAVRMERIGDVLRQVEKQRGAPAAHRVPLLGLAALRGGGQGRTH